ncbi:RNA methyltransferase [Chloroflexus sp.]|uniref:RNA methyltransferase n=1 Tax=Chloroflexus sp. TaxID=1904827 RepID=UPI002ADDBF19|nr:TrmH family RNA methyltransferase [Chloroflexus sp.]
MNDIIVILHQPRDPRNIGAVVRAMLNTGFHHLRLVDPCPFDPATITAVAHRPDPVLTNLTVHANLSEAIADIRYLVGTSDRPHPGLPWRNDVRQWANETHQRAVSAGPIAILFGSEGNGLSRDELILCQEILGLPTAPDYPVLNLAQAVLIVLYELRQATMPLAPHLPPAEPPATLAARERLYTAVADLIGVTGFLKSGNGQILRQRLRTIIARTDLSERDAAVLTALLREVLRKLDRR